MSTRIFARRIGAPAFAFALFFQEAALAQTIIDAPPKNLQIIVWAGQSNAVGKAPVGSQNILGGMHQFMLTLGGKWVKPAFEPSHTTESQWGGSLYPNIVPAGQRFGTGAAVSFLNRIGNLEPNTRFAFVNTAVDGTHIAQHLPPGPIYQMGRSQVLKAKAYGTVAAFIWIQGETDSSKWSRAHEWADNFVKLVSAWRAENGQDLPVVIAQLGDWVEPQRFIYWQTVQKQQRRACSLLAHCAVVSTVGLKKQLSDGAENVHYTADSYHTLGEALALALYALRN